MKIKIIENSLIARIARFKLATNNVAMVIGNAIHLNGVSKEQFLARPKWVKHELKHVEQCKRMGLIKFLFAYCIESIKVGYTKNRFEIEAREAENTDDEDFLASIEFYSKGEKLV